MTLLRETVKIIGLTSTILICTLLFCKPSFAALSLDQLKSFMRETVIPSWEKAATKVDKEMASEKKDSWKNIWRTLDAESKINFGTPALTKASRPSNGDEILANSLWLRRKILSEAADGRYSYAYALDLTLIKPNGGNYDDVTAAFLIHARLALAIDGARCKDRSSPESIVLGYETQNSIRPLIDKLNKMSPRGRALASLQAIAIEEMRGERPPMEWLCGNGMSSINEAFRKGRQPQKVEQGKYKKEPLLNQGNNYSIDISGIRPSLVSDEEWKILRREILDKYLSKAYEAL